MDEVRGEGSAELLDDGSIEIEFAYHDGDEAVLKAKRDTSSTACSLAAKVKRLAPGKQSGPESRFAAIVAAKTSASACLIHQPVGNSRGPVELQRSMCIDLIQVPGAPDEHRKVDSTFFERTYNSVFGNSVFQQAADTLKKGLSNASDVRQHIRQRRTRLLE